MSPLPALLTLLALAAPLGAQLTTEGEVDSKTAPERPPNILLLIADDLGVEGIGAYDEAPDPPYTPHTPVVDQLAAEGVLFRNCWANPACSPTRATMLTGRYSFRTGIGQAISYLWSPIELSPEEVGIPELLGTRYRSGALGKWHLATQADSGVRHPKRFGFDTFRGGMKIFPGYIGDAYYEWEKTVDGKTSTSTVYATTDTVDDALAFIEETSAPWFLWVAFHAPHAPFHKPPADLHTYDLPPEVDDDVTLHMFAMTEAMDTEIGRLLEGVDPEVLEETVILFIGDNGAPPSVTAPPLDPMHAKKTVYEGGLNVPLIVAGPDVARGAVCEALVNSTDLFATIVELANGVQPEGSPQLPLDSVSMVPYLEDPATPSIRPWVYAEFFEPNGLNPSLDRRAMREQRYKLVQTVTPEDGVVDEELYDLLSDPAELVDLLDAPPLGPHPTFVLAALREQMEALNSALPSWIETDGGTAGKQPAPQLTGGGSPVPGSLVSLQLNRAPPDTLGLLIAGPPAGDRAHGRLSPPHPRYTLPVRTDALGQLELLGIWPERAVEEETLMFQVLFPASGSRAEAPTTSNPARLSLR